MDVAIRPDERTEQNLRKALVDPGALLGDESRAVVCGS
jgi:hypothetical protein